MLEKQKKMETQNEQYQKYEAQVSTSSLQTVLENIKNQKNQQSNLLQQQINTPRKQTNQLFTPTAQSFSSPSQKNFRTRQLSSNLNIHNSNNNNKSNNTSQEADQSIDSPSSSTVPLKRFVTQESQFYQKFKRNQTINDDQTVTTTTTNKQIKSPMQKVMQYNNIHTPININNNNNIIRGHTSHPNNTNLLLTFSTAFQDIQSANKNNNNSSLSQSKQINLENTIQTPKSVQGNQTFMLATPKSANGVSRQQARSSYYTSKQNFVKENTSNFPDFSLLQIQLRQSAQIQQCQAVGTPKNDKISLVLSNNENNKSLLDTIPQTQINTNSIQEQNTLPATRSHSNPHSSSMGDQQSFQRQSSTLLMKQNSIFDILYPDLVTQVNRQIGVLKTNQKSINQDVKQVFQRKPSINTLQCNQFKNSAFNSNPPSPMNHKIKLQLNRTQSPGNILSSNQAVLQEVKEQNASIEQIQVHQQQQGLQKNLKEEQKKQINSQMCITYRHLKLDKMFPDTSHSVQTKQYFKDYTKDFQEKFDFEKKQIKIRNQQIPYMDKIEKRLNKLKYDFEKEQFNFISKKNS